MGTCIQGLDINKESTLLAFDVVQRQKHSYILSTAWLRWLCWAVNLSLLVSGAIFFVNFFDDVHGEPFQRHLLLYVAVVWITAAHEDPGI